MRISGYFYHAWIAVAWLGIGCASPPSAKPALAHSGATEQPSQAPIWPKLEQSMRWPQVEHATTGGHSGQLYTAGVRVNPSSIASYQNLVAGTVLPAGTTLVQSHQDARGKAGPIYVMEKTETGWSFSELDATGHIQRTGPLVDCARCHAEAVADSVFGPSRPSTPQNH
jgi:hypothetical protein